MHGFIIDLRDNPGEILDSSVKISNLLLDIKYLFKNNFIVYTKGKNPYIQIGRKDSGSDISLVIIVDGGSIFASEMLCCCFKRS